jgi:hypothetical protein
MISIILKNNYIKSNKKILFEKIITQNITQKTIQLLMNNFTRVKNLVDSKSKIMLKAISNTKFEFFETFAKYFKGTICDLINNNHEKNYLNKYVFKIIEKCLSKFTLVEKVFLNKLYKVTYNIISTFLSTENSKIRKLFRSSVRIIYSIYNINKYSTTKLIKFFQKILFSVIKFTDESLKGKLIKKILKDFVDVNIVIHKHTGDLSEFYSLFIYLTLNFDEFKNNFLLQSFVDRYSNDFINCIKELFKYEVSLGKDRQDDLSYNRLLNQLFSLFYSEKANQNRKTNCIKIICCIIENCESKTKVIILEKIAFQHLSFFMDISNYEYLKILLNCINNYVYIKEVFDVFIKYLDIMFYLCIEEKGKLQDFIDIVEKKIFNSVNKTDLFYLFIKYANIYITNIYDKLNTNNTNNNNNNNEINKVNDITKIKINLKDLNFFLRTLTKFIVDIPNFIDNHILLQDILNIYISFIGIKIANFPQIDFSSKYKLKPNEDLTEFSIYLLILAQNMPCFIFNKNTSLTNPIKIELHNNLKNYLQKKVISEDFKEFNELIKKQKNEMDLNSYIYLLGIYVCFLSRYVILNIFFTENNLQQREILKTKIIINSLVTEKASIINLIEYLKDNIFLYDNDNNYIMFETFSKIFDFFSEKYLEIMMQAYNTRFKQILLSNDLICLLNNSCFYNEKVRNISLGLIKVYSDNFPFILNEYDIFEYNVNVLGKLISQTVSPYNYFIKKIKIDNSRSYYLEFSSEQAVNKEILSKLSEFFEKGLQKSHIINNNNIIYNMSNYINKYSLNAIGNSNKEEMNYSINILQKIYNKMKKVEISNFLKTSAYLEPQKFEIYLKENVYNNFDKYNSISSIDEISNLTDYAKSIILQVRNKYMGIIEGKINNLKVNFINDNLFIFFKKLNLGKIKTLSNNENRSELGKFNDTFVSTYTYYKIMNDINKKLQDIFSRNDNIKKTTENVFPILIELTSFIVYSDINEFLSIFNQNILLDEIINIIVFIPILLGNSAAIETGTFCWEWILYFKKKNLASLMNNLILYVKCLRKYIDSYNNNYVNKINNEIKGNSNSNKKYSSDKNGDFYDINNDDNNNNKINKKYSINSNLDTNTNNINIIQTVNVNTNYINNKNNDNSFDTEINNNIINDINNNNTKENNNIYDNNDNFINLNKISLKNIKTKSSIFDVDNSLGERIINNYVKYEDTTLKELNAKNINFFNNYLGKNKFKFESENFFVIVREKILKNMDLNDYINSQIILLKFVKECMNEFCKSDIEKLYLIYDFIKIFVDLKIDENLYNESLYIYLHFLIVNISLELIEILQDKQSIFQIKSEELSDFIILTFLFSFKFFEFDKTRRSIQNKVLLTEIEQTLINCIEIIMKDRKKTKFYKRKKSIVSTKKNTQKIYNFTKSHTNKGFKKEHTNNFEKNNDDNEDDENIDNNNKEKEVVYENFTISDNIKDLLIYLMESEINNLQYWNSQSSSGSHNIKKKYTPKSSKLKEEKIKEIFESAESISNKLTIQLTQRFPWIERKFETYCKKLGEKVAFVKIKKINKYAYLLFF